MRAITNFWQGLSAMSIRFTISKVMVSYQYMSALSYRKIHLIRFICSRYTFIYIKYFILLLFIFSSSQNSTCHKKNWINCFVIFCNTFFDAVKYIYNLSKASITNTKQTLKYGAMSRVVQSLWDRSWLWFILSGFNDS